MSLTYYWTYYQHLCAVLFKQGVITLPSNRHYRSCKKQLIQQVRQSNMVLVRVSGTIVLSSQTKKFKRATTYSHYMDQKHYRNAKKIWKIISFTLLKPIENFENFTVLHYIPVYEWHFKEQFLIKKMVIKSSNHCDITLEQYFSCNHSFFSYKFTTLQKILAIIGVLSKDNDILRSKFDKNDPKP